MVVEATLEPADIGTIVVYFVLVMAIGMIATFRANRSSTKGFFLAGKSMTFLPIAGSIFATNVGAPMFIGLAGSAAANGFAPVMFEWHATYMLVILGWVFVPIYMASGTFTMPQYLRKRYGGKRLQIYYAIVQLALVVLNGISAEMYAGSLFLQQLLGWNIYLSTAAILAITAVYTIGGGLTAVIYTDALQCVILIIGALILSVMAMDQVGGYTSMVDRFKQAAANTTFYSQAEYGNMTCGFPPDDSFHIFRAMNSDFPWPGLTFGLTLLALYFFCTNQVIVQRNLAAKDVSHSKGACVIASYLKILPFFLFVWPGMASRILYPDEIGCADPDRCQDVCGNRAGCTNIAYPLLVLRVLPAGLRGLMLAALLAALMSSLTSMFNSASSIFTMDLWQQCRPRAKETELVLVGRIFGLFLIGVSIAWLPILQAIQGAQLWDYIQAISSYITPAWVIVFLLGMFWSRCTEPGAFWGLMAGLVTGLCRMGVHFGYPSTYCGGSDPEVRPDVYLNVHYMNFALILASVSLVVTVSVSMVTQPRQQRKLRRVTWWTRKAEQQPDLSSESESDNEDELILADRANKEETKIANKRGCNGLLKAWFCGGEQAAGSRLTKAEKAQQLEQITNISENPFWSRVCDVNAVIAVAITCFVIGFYS